MTKDLLKLKALLEEDFKTGDRLNQFGIIEPFKKAAEADFIPGVEFILDLVADFTDFRFQARLYFHVFLHACQNKNLEVLKILLQKVTHQTVENSSFADLAEINGYQLEDIFPLISALLTFDIDIFREYLKRGFGLTSIRFLELTQCTRFEQYPRSIYKVWDPVAEFRNGESFRKCGMERFKLLLASGSVRVDENSDEVECYDVKLFGIYVDMGLKMDIVDLLQLVFLCGITRYRDDWKSSNNLLVRWTSRKEPHCDKNAACLQLHLQNAMSLKNLSRISVRNAILRSKKNRAFSLEEQISTLELPTGLRNYLLFNYLLSKS